jgi:MFS transporter, ACS family, allantoate permease
MIVLRFVLIAENKRRDKLQQTSSGLRDETEYLEISDVTDRKNLNFRYVY